MKTFQKLLVILCTVFFFFRYDITNWNFIFPKKCLSTEEKFSYCKKKKNWKVVVQWLNCLSGYFCMLIKFILKSNNSLKWKKNNLTNWRNNVTTVNNCWIFWRSFLFPSMLSISKTVLLLGTISLFND